MNIEENMGMGNSSEEREAFEEEKNIRMTKCKAIKAMRGIFAIGYRELFRSANLGAYQSNSTTINQVIEELEKVLATLKSNPSAKEYSFGMRELPDFIHDLKAVRIGYGELSLYEAEKRLGRECELWDGAQVKKYGLEDIPKELPPLKNPL